MLILHHSLSRAPRSSSRLHSTRSFTPDPLQCNAYGHASGVKTPTRGAVPCGAVPYRAATQRTGSVVKEYVDRTNTNVTQTRKSNGSSCGFVVEEWFFNKTTTD